jgi:hypothetical protein
VANFRRDKGKGEEEKGKIAEETKKHTFWLAFLRNPRLA